MNLVECRYQVASYQNHFERFGPFRRQIWTEFCCCWLSSDFRDISWLRNHGDRATERDARTGGRGARRPWQLKRPWSRRFRRNSKRLSRQFANQSRAASTPLPPPRCTSTDMHNSMIDCSSPSFEFQTVEVPLNASDWIGSLTGGRSATGSWTRRLPSCEMRMCSCTGILSSCVLMSLRVRRWTLSLHTAMLANYS